jgi:hypothetical protein
MGTAFTHTGGGDSGSIIIYGNPHNHPMIDTTGRRPPMFRTYFTTTLIATSACPPQRQRPGLNKHSTLPLTISKPAGVCHWHNTDI